MPMSSCLVVLVLAGAHFFSLAEARQSYQRSIPNGANVKRNGVSWPAVGHVTASGSSGAVDAFGAAFAAAGHRWTAALCQADSDGDGYSNGWELGDPCCTWTVGTTPLRTTDISNPGLADSFPLSSPGCVDAAPATPAAPATTSAPAAGAPATTTAPSTTSAPSTTAPPAASTTAAPVPAGSSAAPAASSNPGAGACPAGTVAVPAPTPTPSAGAARAARGRHDDDDDEGPEEEEEEEEGGAPFPPAPPATGAGAGAGAPAASPSTSSPATSTAPAAPGSSSPPGGSSSRPGSNTSPSFICVPAPAGPGGSEASAPGSGSGQLEPAPTPSTPAAADAGAASSSSSSSGEAPSPMIQVTVLSDFAQWSALRPSFVAAFASALSIGQERVLVMNAAAGSVVVSLKVLPGAGPSVAAALAALEAALAGTSLALAGFQVDYARTRVVRPVAASTDTGADPELPFPYHLVLLGALVALCLAGGLALSRGRIPRRAATLLSHTKALGLSLDEAAAVLSYAAVSCAFGFYYGQNSTKFTPLGKLSDALGRVSTLQLLFVLLPVARNSLWLHAFGISWERAIRFHRWSSVVVRASRVY
eukprot:tig00000056_g24073.t1